MDNQHSIEPKSAPTAISLQRKAQSERFTVIKLLTILAEARQASMSQQSLELYSSELSRHEVQDIEAAVRKLMYRRRGEGETAFPDLATLDEEIRGFARIRRQELAREVERKQQEAEIQHRLDHPEEYRAVRDVWAEFMEKRGMAAKAAPAKTSNGSSQPSALTPSQLRELADAIEKQRNATAQQEAGHAEETA